MTDTQIDLIADEDDRRRLFADSLRHLSAVSDVVEHLVHAAGQGDMDAVAELIRRQRELETALMTAMETERRFDEWTKHLGGEGSRDGDLDLDSARHEIGCRLARLRTCGDAGCVS